ncbi:MAG: hypothetical protein HN472_00685 [Nitrospina sp.]|jgi:hypothetical protein|nr:hypothetical protein [Nitrospina sp.]MBT3508042.1 hypothetical protein [Nitrospina sp.]MBT3876569.1 hypothetical protein [Nitrospina sp.]MBT4049588.1 hypothetical protein [Nitrospina sp.]MBT4558300.1 hypothetical protein [Nitrospina sp.]
MNQKNKEITKLLKNKQETCARLLLKMGEQMEAVNKEDDSQLKEIIEIKEGLIAALNETDQKIADLARDLDGTARESLIRENKDLGFQIETDLEKIIKQEIDCQEKLKLVKSEVVEKIKGLRKGQELLKGYERSQRIKPKISKNV